MIVSGRKGLDTLIILIPLSYSAANKKKLSKLNNISIVLVLVDSWPIIYGFIGSIILNIYTPSFYANTYNKFPKWLLINTKFYSQVSIFFKIVG